MSESTDTQSSPMDPGALAEAAHDVARRLAEVDFDPMSLNSPPWDPQFTFAETAQRLWRDRWIWPLYQLGNLDRNVSDFVHWALASVSPPYAAALSAARDSVTPENILWRAMAEQYIRLLQAPLGLHEVWPLEAGGVPWRHRPVDFGGAVEFIPFERSDGASSSGWDPRLAHEELGRLAPGFMARPPLHRETPVAGWLHCRPDDDSLGEVGPWPRRWEVAQTRLFLALSAMRLAAPGLLTSPYGLLLPSPAFWGGNVITAYAEPPHGRAQDAFIRWTAWPGDANLEDALSEARSLLADLLSLTWLADESLVVPGLRVQPAPVTAYVYAPVPYMPKSYLEFALFMLDLASGRSMTEAVVDLWAIMEALFLTTDDGDRGASQTVAKRAALLLTSDVNARRSIRKAVMKFASARQGFAHGRESDRQPFLPDEFRDYYELARRSVAAMVRLAADCTRGGGDASEHVALLNRLASIDQIQAQKHP